MFKSLLEILKQLLGLANDTQENKDTIKSLQSQLERVTETLEKVIFELQQPPGPPADAAADPPV